MHFFSTCVHKYTLAGGREGQGQGQMADMYQQREGGVGGLLLKRQTGNSQEPFAARKATPSSLGMYGKSSQGVCVSVEEAGEGKAPKWLP